MVSKLRLWRSLTNKIEEIKELEVKQKSYTHVKVDAWCLNYQDEAAKSKMIIEDLPLAEGEDIIIVELPKTGAVFTFQPMQSRASGDDDEE